MALVERTRDCDGFQWTVLHPTRDVDLSGHQGRQDRRARRMASAGCPGAPPHSIASRVQAHGLKIQDEKLVESADISELLGSPLELAWCERCWADRDGLSTPTALYGALLSSGPLQFLYL